MMQAPPITAVGAFAATTNVPSNLIQTVTQLMANAASTQDLESKRVKYNQAYQALRQEALKGPLSSELKIKLFELFEVYATKTCYNQESKTNPEDDEEGFRKSARLMELSLMQQLQFLGRASINYNWTQFATLEDLITDLGYGTDQEGFTRFISKEMETDKESLVNEAQSKNVREILTTTLIRLTFSYQNIENFKKDVQLQESCQAMTIAAIGRGTQAQLRKLVDFVYNRCAFLVGIKGGNYQAKIDSYNEVTKLMDECYTKQDFEYWSLHAQIANMRGIIYLKSEIPNRRELAAPLQEVAALIRKDLVSRAETPEEKWRQNFLLCNLITSLADHLNAKTALTAEDLSKAKEYKKTLEDFLEDCKRNNNAHFHNSNWKKALVVLDKLLNKPVNP